LSPFFLAISWWTTAEPTLEKWTLRVNFQSTHSQQETLIRFRIINYWNREHLFDLPCIIKIRVEKPYFSNALQRVVWCNFTNILMDRDPWPWRWGSKFLRNVVKTICTVSCRFSWCRLDWNIRIGICYRHGGNDTNFLLQLWIEPQIFGSF
jgi:hypothetical protein